MIDLDKQHLLLVKQILQTHLPGVTIKAFGSRVAGTAKQFSDLDLVIIGKKSIPQTKLNAVKFAFSNSNLPILVDVVDWHRLTPEFRQKIEMCCVEI